jgi:hypothetical protein
LRYLTVHAEMWCQTVLTLEGAEIYDEPTAYKAALADALLAVEELRASRVADAEELAYYDRAGIPLLKLVLDHDQLCRRVLSDLNQSFKLFGRPMILVVSISV